MIKYVKKYQLLQTPKELTKQNDIDRVQREAQCATV